MATNMKEFRRLAQGMDQRVRQLVLEGIGGRELLHRMLGHMPELQKIWVGADDRQLAVLCQDYPGFYEYAILMEEAAEEERANPIRYAYKDLPQLPEPVKGQFSQLLIDAATLERLYMAFISQQSDTSIAELNQQHQQWLTNRESFIHVLKTAGLPELVSEFALPTLEQIAGRISHLKNRACSE